MRTKLICRLPPKRLAKMRTAQLMRFGVVNPDVASLEALAFTVDGNPVHPDIYENILRLREDMKVGLERWMHGIKEMERISRFSLDRAQAVMADARHHLRMRKMELQQDMQELADQGESSERSALGGSLLDPEFHREAEVDRSQWAFFTFDEDMTTELQEWREFRKLKSLQFEIEELEKKRDKLLEEVKQAEGMRVSVSETA